MKEGSCLTQPTPSQHLHWQAPWWVDASRINNNHWPSLLDISAVLHLEGCQDILFKDFIFCWPSKKAYIYSIQVQTIYMYMHVCIHVCICICTYTIQCICCQNKYYTFWRERESIMKMASEVLTIDLWSVTRTVQSCRSTSTLQWGYCYCTTNIHWAR